MTYATIPTLRWLLPPDAATPNGPWRRDPAFSFNPDMQQNKVLLPFKLSTIESIRCKLSSVRKSEAFGFRSSCPDRGLSGLYPIHYCAFRLDPEKPGIVLKLFITHAIDRGSLILEMAGARRPQPGRGCRRPLGLVERASGAPYGRISGTSSNFWDSGGAPRKYIWDNGLTGPVFGTPDHRSVRQPNLAPLW
jgi:hypothetical protein